MTHPQPEAAFEPLNLLADWISREQLAGLCLESGGKSPATSSERFDLRLIRLRGQVSLA